MFAYPLSEAVAWTTTLAALLALLEAARRARWGGSTFEHAVNAAHRAGVKKLYFFHHDPLRTDAQLEELLEKYRGMIRGKSLLELEMAREGLELKL